MAVTVEIKSIEKTPEKFHIEFDNGEGMEFSCHDEMKSWVETHCDVDTMRAIALLSVIDWLRDIESTPANKIEIQKTVSIDAALGKMEVVSGDKVE